MKSDLYDLISSLTKNEKRYFKLETCKPKNKKHNYLIIYDILSNQQTYDPTALEDALKQKAPHSIKRLSALKSYLYQLILKILCQYHEAKNSAIEFSNLLQRVDIVYMKGLYRQSKKLLNQAKKIAEANQLYAQLQQVYQWEYKLVFMEEKYYKSQRKIDHIQQQQAQSIKLLTKRYEFDKKYTDTSGYIYQYGPPSTVEAKKTFQKITEFSPAIVPPHTRYTADIFHFVKSTYHYFMGNLEEALLHTKARLDVFEKHPQLVIDDTHQYLKVIYNYVQTLLAYKLPDFEEILRYIQTAKQIGQQPKIVLDGRTLKVQYFLVYSHSTRVYMEQGLFEKSIQLGHQLKLKASSYAQLDKNENEFFIYLNLSFCNFVKQDYDEAIFWMQRVLNDRSNTVRFDLLSYARILHIMIHYELQNFYLLTALIDGTQRYISEHEQLKTPEILLLSMFQKISSKPSTDPVVYKSLLQTAEALQKYMNGAHFSHEYIRQFRVIEWIESKLNKQSYRAIIQQKIKQTQQ